MVGTVDKAMAAFAQASAELDAIKRRMDNPAVPEERRQRYPARIAQLENEILPRLTAQLQG